VLTEAVAPRDVIRAAGDWVGKQLAPEGFRWLRSQLRFRRQADGLIYEIELQPSRYNRRDEWISCQSVVLVRDPALQRWRRANPDRTISDSDYLCGTGLGYASGRANGFRYGEYSDGELDLTDPALREENLKEWLAKVRTGVLPFFSEVADPDTIVTSRAAEICGRPDAIEEWLIFRARADLVPAFADFVLSAYPQWRKGFDEGQAMAATDELPSPTSSAPCLGWVLAVNQ
jgi:hypothetical protein